jgi:predicted phage tail protein
MSRRVHSKKRVVFGVFAIILGVGLIAGFDSGSLYFGLGLFGPAGYSAVMIALGIALILKKDPLE